MPVFTDYFKVSGPILNSGSILKDSIQDHENLRLSHDEKKKKLDSIVSDQNSWAGRVNAINNERDGRIALLQAENREVKNKLIIALERAANKNVNGQLNEALARIEH